jgi:hypothetical protein
MVDLSPWMAFTVEFKIGYFMRRLDRGVAEPLRGFALPSTECAEYAPRLRSSALFDIALRDNEPDALLRRAYSEASCRTAQALSVSSASHTGTGASGSTNRRR